MRPRLRACTQTQALKNLGLDITRAELNADGNRNRFYVTDAKVRPCSLHGGLRVCPVVFGTGGWRCASAIRAAHRGMGHADTRVGVRPACLPRRVPILGSRRGILLL